MEMDFQCTEVKISNIRRKWEKKVGADYDVTALDYVL